MPWTRKQVKYLLSKVSPETPAEKAKMKAELDANPALGHAQKGHFNIKNRAKHEEKIKHG